MDRTPAAPRAGDRTRQRNAFATAESIASRNRSNLHLSSSYLSDARRYRAFCAYYALMRVVDDRIDALAERESLPRHRSAEELRVLGAWQEGVRACYATGEAGSAAAEATGHRDAEMLFEAFSGALTLIRPPPSLWEDFFRAMRWDLHHERFDTWTDFLRYADGASVAPTTIYLFLLAARPDEGTTSLPDGFDIVKCGRELGRFAYLGHIVRDLAEDLRMGANGLLYFARDDMTKHEVTEELLFHDLDRGTASQPTRNLVADILARAAGFLRAGRASMECLDGQLDSDCAFVLELIVTLYARVIDKIAACSYDPFGEAHRLTALDKQNILVDVAKRLAYQPTRRMHTKQQEQRSWLGS